MTVVIDCNILVICLTSRSPYHHIYKSLVAGKFNLAVTSEILLEYEEVIIQKYGSATANAFLALLAELPNVSFIHTHYQWNLIAADTDDNKYCDCTLASNSDYLVTEDNHFNILTKIPFPKIQLLTIDAFAKVIS